MYQYQVGDVVQAGTTIVRIHRIDGDRAWYYGTELGESSQGGLAIGWMKPIGSSPLLRREGKSVSPEAEELYQQACRLFPDQPWLKVPKYVHPRITNFFHRRR